MNRRAVLAGGVVVLLVTSGCVGFLTGSESLEFTATQATVSDQALDETGYSQNDVRSQTITRTVSAAGQEREVEVTNRVARYGRSIELGPAGEQELGVFVVVSTPQVEVLGRTFNPVGEMSNRELLGRVQSQYQGFEVGNRVGSRAVTVLGEETTLDKFEAEATIEGTSVDLFVHVTTVAHDDDFVIAIGVYPRQLPGEEDRVVHLLDGIRH